MSNDPHRGRWQAQGNDIKTQGGYSERWGLPNPPTKAQGAKHVQDLRGQCHEREHAVRSRAFEQAERHIQRAPPEGYLAPHIKSFNVASPPKKAQHARVDLEVLAGRAYST